MLCISSKKKCLIVIMIQFNFRSWVIKKSPSSFTNVSLINVYSVQLVLLDWYNLYWLYQCNSSFFSVRQSSYIPNLLINCQYFLFLLFLYKIAYWSASSYLKPTWLTGKLIQNCQRWNVIVFILYFSFLIVPVMVSIKAIGSI